MCSSSGFPLCHWWSQWRLGKIETRYLLSHIRMNRQLPEIGFHFDVRGSVACNCHGILLFNPFPSPFLSLYYSCGSLPSLAPLFLSAFHVSALSFVHQFPPSPSVWHCDGTTLRKVNLIAAFFVFSSDCMHSKAVLWLFRGDKWREWIERCGRTELREGVSAWLVMDPGWSVWCCQSRVLHKNGRELFIHFPPRSVQITIGKGHIVDCSVFLRSFTGGKE